MTGVATTPGAPTGWNSVTCQLVVEDVRSACEFYQKIGFTVEQTVQNGQGGWFWATLRIGNSRIFVTESESPSSPAGTPSGPGIYCYVPNVEAVYRTVNRLGWMTDGPIADEFWGDQTFTVTDPFGFRWTFATHVRDVPPQEFAQAAYNH